ncbi:TetR/AcrR family transcriptional regulator [Candidatus Enterococcus courvalinii]|uniref:TetR family transcriptional regulator n=1 Tax=Candidatus Enterococcus courvalinii TaxID=2815329 RepID=A0ABS3HZ53_9ENTE|nr:TetR/AcrR family transcriptional regulator [Enterococcus sp. MSG2901]MBO0481742.1 TetR family transcriptional regulator [Enterococcus sp. MSG2901]
MKSKEKLQHAAMSLFTRNGFDQTTIKEIASLAGVTERTFFRQFKDKADIFFESKNELLDELTSYIEEHYQEESSLFDLLLDSLKEVQVFDQNRERTLMREQIIQSHSDLIERELLKLYDMKQLLIQKLTELNVSDDEVKINFVTSVVFQIMDIAYKEWLKNENITFKESVTVIQENYLTNLSK